MKKLILSISFLLLTGIMAIGQTTATDFTAPDCSSGSHTLFTELNAGKVVVLVWVMPCSMCISDGKAGYDVVQAFSTSNPGKVVYWLADDLGDNSCSSMSSWATTNGIGPLGMTILDNSGVPVNEADYGGGGMPHVVVIGSDHVIYYNKLDGQNDDAAITSAINNALAKTVIAPVANVNNELMLFPNPARDKVSINYNLVSTASIDISVYDVIGNIVKTEVLGEQAPGKHSTELNFVGKLSNGTYFLKLNTGTASQVIKFTVAD